jgi:hypothetical protein
VKAKKYARRKTGATNLSVNGNERKFTVYGGFTCIVAGVVLPLISANTNGAVGPHMKARLQ